MLKKYLSVLAVIVVLIGCSSSAVFAQDKNTSGVRTPGKSKIPEINKLKESVDVAKTDNQNNFGKLSFDGWNYGLASVACVFSNLNGDCPSDGNTVSQGAYESLVGFIGTMYESPPASTQTYVASVMQDLNIGAQPAYAQGLGFSALNPILSVWRTMRNIAYFFFVVIFLVIGFMIMFRQKIGSQAVVTAQQAIPNIIVALLAVTFSYAIAGLLIDGMYLVMFLIAGLFGKVQLIDGNVFQIAGNLIQSNIAGTSANAIGEFVNQALGQGVVGALAGAFTTISAAVVILLVIVFNTFKLFFALLKTYIELILAIAFAPIILMVGAIPGQNPFGSWLKSIIGNLAVFPFILLLLIIFDVLRDATSSGTGGFLPPYLAGFSDPAVLPFLAGLALILALPQAVDEIKKALGATQGGLFFNLVQTGIKNANQYRKTGMAIAGGAMVGAALTPVGAAVGYKVASARGAGTRGKIGGALAGGAVGLAGPVAAPIVAKGVGKGLGIANRALASTDRILRIGGSALETYSNFGGFNQPTNKQPTTTQQQAATLNRAAGAGTNLAGQGVAPPIKRGP